MLMALMRIEPRTPRSSFFFRGPARFERDGGGQTIFNFNARSRPVSEGFASRNPISSRSILVGPGSNLDPFVYIQAMQGQAPPPTGKSGGAQHVAASNSQRFSYQYAIPGSPAGKAASFEYINETTGGAFKMTSLVWVGFLNAKRTTAGGGESDVVSFTAIGTWNQGEPIPHMATVQISTAPDMPYVSILIDGGMLSNVNTKPDKAVLPIPDSELF
jgi:hypothetical protein